MAPAVGVNTVIISEERSSSTSGDSKAPGRARDALRHKMVRSKTPPPRLSHGSESDCISPRSRGRTSSRDYTHSYDGNYGAGNDDMIGVDLARTTGGWWEQHQLYIFASYVLGFGLLEVVVAMVLSTADGEVAAMTFTVTNVIHFFCHLIYLHWTKGGYGELQGELDSMTLWEQIEATPGTEWLRFGLRFVPTVICYLACIEAQWEWHTCIFNGFVWFVTQLGKLPFMNGVRIFGINSHPIIDKEE